MIERSSLSTLQARHRKVLNPPVETMAPLGADDIEGNSALRFIYMDDDDLLSPTNSPMKSLNDSSNLSIKGVADWNQHSTTPPTSPRLEKREFDDHGSRGNRTSNISMHSRSSSEQQHEHPKRKSIRKSLTYALTSPVRAATKGKLSLTSPLRKSSKSSSGSVNSKDPWQKQLDLPPGVKPDQAIAYLLAKELDMLDF